MYPHTKGAQFFAVGHGNEYRQPRKGFLRPDQQCKASGNPSWRAEMSDKGERVWCDLWTSCLLASLPEHIEVRTV
ncbi:hypothetical protein D5072_14935 [Dickeya dianthicola]|uniref:Uncharacterized protein n=1 Tax=Dickeya dianthicola TaxID=204039 RepID=A0ABX9NKC2_9GAMM|nr:hypothetical protein D5077_20780 [Dickeya dianthicola]RJL66278.1 hypothetical protein D5072_14935 [Dickeya dianthicola]